MNLFWLFVFLLYGCSSQSTLYKQMTQEPKLKSKVLIKTDYSNNSLILDKGYSNGLLEYKRMVSLNKINSDVKWSCYKSSRSTNYVEMTPQDIPFFRTFHLDHEKTISYRKEDKINNGYYLRFYKESTSDSLNIKSSSCIIKINDESYYVISEIYDYKR